MLMKLFWLILSQGRIFLKAYGIDLKRFGRSVRHTGQFIGDYRAYKRQLAASSTALRQFPLQLRRLYPALSDYDEAAGSLGVYFHQDLWAARKVFERRPAQHVDIGSRIDGFVGHLLVFMDVSVVDVRDMRSDITGLDFVHADATRMDRFETDSVDSLSSLHAAEHFGLGRYGDTVDPDACFTFMGALQRALKPGGRLLFSVPIGPEGVHFNAHRVFSPGTIAATFDQLSLVSFATIKDHDQVIEDADPALYLQDRFKVGLFEFTKPEPVPPASPASTA